MRIALQYQFWHFLKISFMAGVVFYLWRFCIWFVQLGSPGESASADVTDACSFLLNKLIKIPEQGGYVSHPVPHLRNFWFCNRLALCCFLIKRCEEQWELLSTWAYQRTNLPFTCGFVRCFGTWQGLAFYLSIVETLEAPARKVKYRKKKNQKKKTRVSTYRRHNLLLPKVYTPTCNCVNFQQKDRTPKTFPKPPEEAFWSYTKHLLEDRLTWTMILSQVFSPVECDMHQSLVTGRGRWPNYHTWSSAKVVI